MDIFVIVAMSGLRRSAVSARQSHELAADSAIFQQELADAHRQFEPPRTGAAGVEIEHAISRLLFGDMTVAADHDGKPCGLRIEIQPPKIVQHVNGKPCAFEHFMLRQLLRPRIFIDIAPNHRDRSNCGELLDYLG
jgi:hypothetical protein